jgi:hypothetical protein
VNEVKQNEQYNIHDKSYKLCQDSPKSSVIVSTPKLNELQLQALQFSKTVLLKNLKKPIYSKKIQQMCVDFIHYLRKES